MALLVGAVCVLGLRPSEGPSMENGLSLCALDRWNTWGRTGLEAKKRDPACSPPSFLSIPQVILANS